MDVDHSHPQVIVFLRQRDATLAVGKLLDHRGELAVTGTVELGNELDLVRHASLASQVFEKALDCRHAPIGFHGRQQ
ncbi:hypothetical protein D9M73_230420 [compost metagenome]